MSYRCVVLQISSALIIAITSSCSMLTERQGPEGEPGPQGEQGNMGESGLASLISVTPEPAGDNCSAGGNKAETGMDDNRNGVLDPDEVDSAAYICNGIQGPQGDPGDQGEQGLHVVRKRDTAAG